MKMTAYGPQNTTDARQDFPDPRKLLTLSEAAAYCRVDGKLLSRWSVAGYAHHYYLGEQGPYFLKSEIKEWVTNNLLEFRGGIPIPSAVPIALADVDIENPPPLAISLIPNLCRLNVHKTSGIYFLCDGGSVVYVGQSNFVLTRIATHLTEKKKVFDLSLVFFLPCPVDALLATERHFIRLLKPKYNGNPTADSNQQAA